MSEVELSSSGVDNLRRIITSGGGSWEDEWMPPTQCLDAVSTSLEIQGLGSHLAFRGHATSSGIVASVSMDFGHR